MPESVLRLRVDNKEYDDSLKSATAGVRALITEMRKNGEEVDKVSASEAKFIQSLGKMETSSNNAKGKLRELQKSLKDLTYEYQQMSDAERKGQIGQAMSKAMQDLKPRIEAAKREVADMTRHQAANKDSLSGLTSALGINMKSLAGWGAAIGAAKTALSVMGDALMSSETNVDEWGRTVASTQAVYDGFCAALNNMDISGYLNRIDEIVQAAKEAYDALDELGTLSGIRGAERAQIGRKITEQRAIIRRSGKDSEEGRAAQAQLELLSEQMKRSYKSEASDEMDAFRKLVDKRLAEGGIKLDEKSYEHFIRTFTNEGLFKAFRANAKGSYETVGSMAYSSNYGGGTMSRTVDTRNANQKLLDLFTDKWRSENAAHIERYESLIGQAANLDFANVRYTSEPTSPKAGTKRTTKTEKINPDQSSGIAGTSPWDLKGQWLAAQADAFKAAAAEAPNYAKEWGEEYKKGLSDKLYDLDLASKLNDSMQVSEVLQQQLQYWEEYFESLKSLYKKDSDEYKAIEEEKADKTKVLSGQILVAKKKEADALAKSQQKEAAAKLAEDAARIQDAWSGAANAIGNLGYALEQIEDPGAKVAGLIAEAIATIASTFAASLKGSFTIWDWIAGATAGAATMMSTIAAIKSATAEYHAGGGFVGGGPKGTDTINTWLTPGELVLNEAQQANVASKLSPSAQRQGGLGVVVEGEKMYTCLSNYMNRSNKRLPS